MFDAGMRTTLAQRLVSIVSSVFDQTCFNRLATHFNISMFGHQTLFDGVWSPNNSRLTMPVNFWSNVSMAFKFYQTRPNTIKHNQTAPNKVAKR